MFIAVTETGGNNLHHHIISQCVLLGFLGCDELGLGKHYTVMYEVYINHRKIILNKLLFVTQYVILWVRNFTYENIYDICTGLLYHWPSLLITNLVSWITDCLHIQQNNPSYPLVDIHSIEICCLIHVSFNSRSNRKQRTKMYKISSDENFAWSTIITMTSYPMPSLQHFTLPACGCSSDRLLFIAEHRSGTPRKRGV